VQITTGTGRDMVSMFRLDGKLFSFLISEQFSIYVNTLAAIEKKQTGYAAVATRPGEIPPAPVGLKR